MKLEAKQRLTDTEVYAASWTDDLDDGINLYGHKALAKALDALLKPVKSSVSMKRAELYIDLPEKNKQAVGELTASGAFHRALAAFNLEQDDNDFRSRVDRDDDFFVINVVRKNPKKPVKS